MNARTQLKRMSERAAEAEGFLQMFANRHRLMILCSLLEQERSVGELALLLGIAQPNVSQHLFKLKSQGMVASRREGTSIYYSIGDGDVRGMIDMLYRRFCQAR